MAWPWQRLKRIWRWRARTWTRPKPLYWSEKGKAGFAVLETQWSEYTATVGKLREMSARSKLSEQQEAMNYLFEDVAKMVNKVDDQMTALANLK